MNLPIIIDAHPDRREEAIAAAHRVLADITHHGDDTLAHACHTLLALSSDPHDRTLAAESLGILTPTPHPATHGTRPAAPAHTAPGRQCGAMHDGRDWPVQLDDIHGDPETRNG